MLRLIACRAKIDSIFYRSEALIYSSPNSHHEKWLPIEYSKMHLSSVHQFNLVGTLCWILQNMESNMQRFESHFSNGDNWMVYCSVVDAHNGIVSSFWSQLSYQKENLWLSFFVKCCWLLDQDEILHESGMGYLVPNFHDPDFPQWWVDLFNYLLFLKQ